MSDFHALMYPPGKAPQINPRLTSSEPQVIEGKLRDLRVGDAILAFRWDDHLHYSSNWNPAPTPTKWIVNRIAASSHSEPFIYYGDSQLFHHPNNGDISIRFQRGGGS